LGKLLAGTLRRIDVTGASALAAGAAVEMCVRGCAAVIAERAGSAATVADGVTVGCGLAGASATAAGSGVTAGSLSVDAGRLGEGAGGMLE
jgi:hypothetical protein